MGDGRAEGFSIIGEGGQASISLTPDTDEKGSVVVASGFWSTGLIVVTHGFSCSVAHVIFLDQGLNPNLLHCQVDYSPLNHQGSVGIFFENSLLCRISLLCSKFLLFESEFIFKK